MVSIFVENILSELSLDYRIIDGMFDPNKNEHVDILREYLFKRGFDIGFVHDYINNLNEGKYPERQAYNIDGKLVTFSTKESKQEAIRNKTHFEIDPTQKDGEEKQKIEKSKPETKEEEPKKKETEDDKKKEDGKESDGVEKNKSEKKEQPQEEKTKKDSEEVQLGGLDSKKEDDEEEKEKSKDDWKVHPEDTRRRAEALGWYKDESGSWYCDSDLVGITGEDGYVIPVKDGDKDKTTEWPTHGCSKE